MRTSWIILGILGCAAALGVLLFVFARGGGSAELAELKEMREEMCACKDFTCVDEVNMKHRTLKRAMEHYEGKKPRDVSHEYMAVLDCVSQAYASPSR